MTKTTTTDQTKGLRVQQFESANVKRLTLVSFTLDDKGGLVIIGGDNYAGKSSVIDSLLYALGGKKAVAKGTKVIREGETEAHVHVDLGAIVIDRRWTAEGVDSVKITTQDGHALKDVTDVLDSLGGGLVFDPLALLSMKPAERRAELLRLIDLPFSLAEKDAEHDRIFSERTDVNRQLKSAKAVAEQAAAEVGGVSADGPTLEEALTAHNAATTWEITRSHLAARERRARQDLQEHDLAIVQAREKLGFLEAEREGVVEAHAAAQIPLEQHEVTVPDFDALDAAVAEARQRQKQSAAIAERDRMSEQAETLARESEALTKALEAIVAEKAKALREAKMPVDGLGFDDADLTYNGLPFAQASGAEQLRVSVGIAMALAPTARIILSKDGSILDKHNLAILNEMTADRGFQVFLERIGDGDEGAIVIEDGAVRS